MHPRWTDISTSVMLGADAEAPSPSPALAFAGDADMVFQDQEKMPGRRRGRRGTGIKLRDSEPRFMSGVEAFMSLVNLASTQHTFRAGHVIYTPHFLFVDLRHPVNF